MKHLNAPTARMHGLPACGNNAKAETLPATLGNAAGNMHKTDAPAMQSVSGHTSSWTLRWGVAHETSERPNSTDERTASLRKQ